MRPKLKSRMGTAFTFQPTSLRISGFKCFNNEQTIQPTTTGLYYLSGENLVDPSLGANGIGKSTLFDALFWCLYGKTSRGLRASNVVSWSLPSDVKCRVTVEALLHGEEVNITRSQNPNLLTLSIEGEVPRVVQEMELQHLLGVSEETFHRCCYMSQFHLSFLDLPPAEKMKVLSEALRLEEWDLCVESAASNVRVAKETLTELSAKGERIKGLIDGIDLPALKRRAGEWEDQVTGERLELEKKAAGFLRALENERVELEKLDGELELNRTARLNLEKNQEEEEVALRKLQKDQDWAANKIKTLEESVEKHRRMVLKFENLERGVCPECEQEVGAEHASAHITSYKKLIARDRAQIKEYEEKVSAAKKALDKARANLFEIKEMAKAETKRAISISEVKQKRTATVTLLTTERRHIAHKLKEISPENNPHRKALVEAKERLVEAKGKLEQCKKDMEAQEYTLARNTFWVDGFKALRLEIVQEAVDELDVTVNNALDALGLVGWQVQVLLETENKSGSVRKGVTILVRSKESENLVPVECWSGGEAQRLKLAVAVGLSDLISNQLGFRCGWEMWDEPTSWLASEGVSAVLDMLADRAQASGKTLLLADHRSLDYARWAGAFWLTKTAEGTRVEPV